MKLHHFRRKERSDLWGVGDTFVTHLLQYLILPQKEEEVGLVSTKCSLVHGQVQQLFLDSGIF
jgi:hypothetical protein